MPRAHRSPSPPFGLRRNLPALSLIFAAALAPALLLPPPGARATAATTTWHVGPSSAGACTQSDPNCRTIQSAVDAASAGDTIQVAAGTYAEHVTIGKDLTINGVSARLTVVDGTQTGRVFTINSGTVNLSGLTIRNGKTTDATNGGGGILNSGTLSVTLCTVSNNSVDPGGGGGILNFGTVNVTASTLSGNSAESGGAVFNAGVLNITSSTISGNNASGTHLESGGGGIYNKGALNITSSTISDNSGVGIHNHEGGKYLVRSSILAGNTSAGVSGPGDLDGTPGGGSGGYNIVGAVFGGFGFTLGDPGDPGSDIVGYTYWPVDPHLLPLGDYGGPTQTQPPRPFSRAIDQGDDSVLGQPLGLLTDQRGHARKVGLHVDSGAVEFDPASDAVYMSTNEIDEPRFFVTQHYIDFLDRTYDTAGLDFWTSNITQCGSDAACTEVKRVNTSAAFFLSIEFQSTGYFVYCAHKAAFGYLDPPKVPVPVRFQTYFADEYSVGNEVIVGNIDWEQRLAYNKFYFALDFVQRPEFLARYPAQTSATAFVNSLDANAGGVLNDAERSALISELSPNPADPYSRKDVLIKVAEDAVSQQKDFDRAFVLMEYFGYLRRDPDSAPDADFSGYDFWLNKLNSFGGDFQEAEMVKAFIDSTEYRHRFGQ